MTRFLASTCLATGLAAGLGGAAMAEPVAYEIDPSHSEILFAWQHGGFSTTRGLVFDMSGEIMFDEQDPANSSVSISFPVSALNVTSGLYEHLMSDDFFGSEDSEITFESTSIEVTDDQEANITGDLTINGTTQEVVLDAELTEQGEGPMGDPVTGFDAETTILRSDYGLGAFVPFVSDEVDIDISLEATPAEQSGN